MVNSLTSFSSSLGVVGDGVMGWQITLLAASKGINVHLIGRGVKKEKLFKRTARFLGLEANKLNFTFSNDINSLKNKSIIIEALPENLSLKLEVINLLNKFKETIICSNTSSLDLNKLLIESSKMCALHFINPVNSFRFVEFSCFPEFSEKKQKILDFVKIIEYDIYECPPTDGLIVNRLLFSYLDTVMKLSDQGMSPDTCDQIFKRLTGANLNSKKVMKLIGEEVCDSIFANFKAKSYLPK